MACQPLPTGSTVSDVLTLDPDDARPPYRQLAEAVRAEVDSGTYPPGAKLPSYDTLAESFGVSLGVVKRAMKQLQDERVIVIRHGQGSYVRAERGGPGTEDRATLADLRAEMTDLSARLEAVERQLAER